VATAAAAAAAAAAVVLALALLLPRLDGLRRAWLPAGLQVAFAAAEVVAAVVVVAVAVAVRAMVRPPRRAAAARAGLVRPLPDSPAAAWRRAGPARPGVAAAAPLRRGHDCLAGNRASAARRWRHAAARALALVVSRRSVPSAVPALRRARAQAHRGPAARRVALTSGLAAQRLAAMAQSARQRRWPGSAPQAPAFDRHRRPVGRAAWAEPGPVWPSPSVPVLPVMVWVAVQRATRARRWLA
jgi:hypothetical protein